MRILLLLFIFEFANAAGPFTIKRNNDAAKLLQDDKSGEAQKILSDVVVKSPFDGEVRLNLGFAFEKNGDPERAIKEYLSAEQISENPELKFYALFNAARVRGEQKKVDEALDLYQRALVIRPDSEEVKTNIELLIQNKGGGGEGDSKNQNQQNNQQDQKDQQQQPQDPKQNQQKQRPTPKPFQSKELSQQDMKQILDELKRQEQQVRAKELQKKQQKESPSGRDW